MIIYVDIDETICTNEPDRDYAKAKPIKEHIEKINALYEKGHTIVYWTARGGTTGIDWRIITKDQLKKWQAKYHQLEMGNKPHFDILIDDKAINIEGLNSL
jgi:hypothetical protein